MRHRHSWLRPARTDRDRRAGGADRHAAGAVGRIGDRSTSNSTTMAGAAGRGGGRRSRRMFESGELRLVLLKLIADEPRHGYDLIRAIEDLTGGEYAPSPGVVYPTLTLLQDMGLIEEAAGEGPRKPFQVTDEGRAHLEEKADEVEALFERLEDLAPSESHQRRAGDRPGGQEPDDRAPPSRRPRRAGRGSAARDRRDPRRGGAADRAGQIVRAAGHASVAARGAG